MYRWSMEARTPPSVWLGGLLQPSAFVIAVMQLAARDAQQPLDNMVFIPSRALLRDCTL